MKSNLFYLLFFISIITLSCNKDSDDDSPNQTIPVLTDQVEVYNPAIISDNLILAIESGGNTSYLINKAGEKLHIWNFEANLGNDFELLPNGKALGIFKPSDPVISFGGYGGIIKLINPDSSIDWEFPYYSDNYIAHHDVEMLPNGNVIFLVWEKITALEAQQAGVNVDHDIYPEKLIEINPSTNQIVWEWRSWDHIIQDFDANAPNFGDISMHPERININYNLQTNGDFMHANGIDYDNNKDILFISVNFFHEIWVIDHSTTTQQAASSIGGNYNKGGDLLYRFGNPNTYNNTFGNKLFDNNHFPNLIEEGKPGEGNILVYVNGGSIDQSTVYELEIPETLNLTPNTNNEPNIAWSFTNSNLFFGRISGANRLQNGNTLICEGDYGYWEVAPNGEIAWKYNGTALNYWRGYEYEFNHSGLEELGLNF